MKTILLPVDHPDAVHKAMEVFFSGGLVAFPTDTVYGLGTLVHRSEGISRLYEVKGRDPNKAIAVLIGDLDQLAQVTPQLTPPARLLAERFWPGALTLVVTKLPLLPENLSPLPTIGVRMPNHPFSRSLMQTVGPLATTSANISRELNTVNAQQVMEQLGGRIDLILDGGEIQGGVPSTVVDCTLDPPIILRQGVISKADIIETLGM